jgi:streptogramin lyase
MESPHALHVDSNDRIWVGGQSSGWLTSFSLQDTTFTLYEISDDDVEVKNLRVDPTGDVWIVDSAGNRIGRITTTN